MKCGEQAHKNKAYRKDLQQKGKSARDFFLHLHRNHKNDHNCSKMQIVFLSRLIRQEQRWLRREREKLLLQKNRVNAIQLHLDELQFQFNLKTLKRRQDAREIQNIRNYVQSEFINKDRKMKTYKKKSKMNITTKSLRVNGKEIYLRNPNKHRTKHIAMSAKTVTVTQSDDFFLHENKNENGDQNDILSGFSSNSFTKQHRQNVTTSQEKSEENTPILTNFANKTFPYLSEIQT